MNTDFYLFAAVNCMKVDIFWKNSVRHRSVVCAGIFSVRSKNSRDDTVIGEVSEAAVFLRYIPRG